MMRLFVFFGVLTAGSACALAQDTGSRPNILWITCEDTSPTLGCYGDRFARTPNLDQLARDGVRYTHAFATAPVCSPSRACLITGLYATTLGNGALRCEIPIPATIRSYAARLREAGYFTSNNSKTDYNLADKEAFVARAWDQCGGRAHWRQRAAGQPFLSVFNLTHTHQSRASVYLWKRFETMAAKHLLPAERSDPERVVVPPYYPDTLLARRTLARYYDCVTIMDKAVGDILQELTDDGLANETVVFFYSDHGMGLPRGKRTLFDTGMQVPLIIRFPAHYAHLAPAQPGETVDRLVSFIDFAPTVLSLAGVAVPASMQGRPFLGHEAGPPPAFVYGARDRVDEAYELSRSVRDGRWLYIRNYMPHLSWMQPEGYSDQSDFRRELVQLAAEKKLNAAQLTYAARLKPLEELYDTQTDPHQVHNVASELKNADILTRMQQAHRAWVLETRDLGFVPEGQLVKRIGTRTPHEFGQARDAYPLEHILATAELVGQTGAVPILVDRLADADPTVRYWALVGLRAAGSKASVARDAMAKSMRDPSASVRIEAAGILAAIDDNAEALRLLADTLGSDDPDAVLHAARTLQLLGEHARPVLAELVRTRENAPDSPQGKTLLFSLQAAVDALQAKR